MEGYVIKTKNLTKELDTVYCILVNWNLGEITVECIRSLIQAGMPDNHIILVDNGSSDDSISLFEANILTHVILFKNNTNLGYAKAVNQGVEIALSKGAKWVFVVNNDTFFAPDFFEHLFGSECNTTYDLFGPLILWASNKEKIWFSGARVIPGTLITYSPIGKNRDIQNLPTTIQVDFLNGCGMFIKADVIKKIGFYNENLIMYGEEVDFCWRAKKAGYLAACFTKAKMWHMVSKSSTGVKPFVKYLRIRNQIFFYRKYSIYFQYLIMFLFSIYLLGKSMTSDIIPPSWSMLGAALKGWRDGWFKNII